MKKKVLIVFGTRPEAIKMVPVIMAFQSDKNFELKVCVTAQHREMLDQVLDLFDIQADYDLDIMSHSQTLTEITSRIMTGLDKTINDYKPDLLLVHGDTATTISSSLTAFYNKIKICHVEAGLRTMNIQSPWPEEANRRLTSILTDIHFAPTEHAKNNLIQEGVCEENICVTGNTVVDVLFMALDIIKKDLSLTKTLETKFSYLDKNKKIVLVTGHRRESFGQGFKNICNALKTLAINNNDLQIVYPVHMNPNVKGTVEEILSGIDNIILEKPLDYLPFCYLMNRSHIILTDSGGIQEEAPSIGKPVLVMRDNTERPEAVIAGTVKLVGTKVRDIIDNTNNLINNEDEYLKMSKSINPYGDGKASNRIVNFLRN